MVFGGAGLGGSTVTLNALGTGGFTLRGFENGALVGWSVSGAGDVNGDGFADLLVGAAVHRRRGDRPRRGVRGVWRGGLGGSTVTLNALGAGGFTLQGFENWHMPAGA